MVRCAYPFTLIDPDGSFDLLYFCSAGPEITRMWGLCDPSLRLNLIDGIKSRTRAEGGVWCGSWRSWEWGEAKASAPVTHSLTHSLITSPSRSSSPFLMDGTPTLRSGLHIQGCDTGAHPAVSRAAKWHACHFHWQTRSSAYPRSSDANARHDCILMEPRCKQDSAAEINTSWAMRSDLEDRGVFREGQRALMHRDTWVTALFLPLSAILDFWDEILSLGIWLTKWENKGF